MPTEVRLVPLAPAHLEGVEGLLKDPDVLRFTRVPDPVPEGFAARWIERYGEGREDRSRIGFAALDSRDQFVGLALAPSIEAEGGEVELGYIVAPERRGEGLGRQILTLLTDWAFKELGAQRIVLIIDVTNKASEGMARRCGYTLEGVMRSSHLKQGIRVDAGIWSRLPSDPPPG